MNNLDHLMPSYLNSMWIYIIGVLVIQIQFIVCRGTARVQFWCFTLVSWILAPTALRWSSTGWVTGSINDSIWRKGLGKGLFSLHWWSLSRIIQWLQFLLRPSRPERVLELWSLTLLHGTATNHCKSGQEGWAGSSWNWECLAGTTATVSGAAQRGLGNPDSVTTDNCLLNQLVEPFYWRLLLSCHFQ